MYANAVIKEVKMGRMGVIFLEKEWRLQDLLYVCWVGGRPEDDSGTFW